MPERWVNPQGGEPPPPPEPGSRNLPPQAPGWGSPARATVAVTALFLLLYVILWILGELNVQGTDEAFINSFGYHLWSAVAALSATLWAVLLRAGIHENKELAKAMDFGVWARNDWWTKLGYYITFIALGWVLVSAIQYGLGVDDPIAWWKWGVSILFLMGAIAAAPWVLLVWRAHEQIHRIDIKSIESIDRLTSTWSRIENSMLALTLLVTSATVTTAAQRIAVTTEGKQAAGGKLEPFVDPTSYPPSRVLLYGAFFTVLLAFAVFPLVFTWRAQAWHLVNYLAPVEFEAGKNDGDRLEAADKKRSKLETHLHLDKGLIQSPLTALSVLTPLLTSILAGFIPELGGD